MKAKKLFLFLFHKDTLAFIAGLVFLWLGLSILWDSRIDIKELVPHHGYFSKLETEVIRTKNKPLYKEVTWELRFFISGEPGYFTTTAQLSTGGYGQYYKEFAPGDPISLYTRDRPFGILGIGNDKAIMHMVNNKTRRVVIDFEEKKRASVASMYIALFGGLGFLIFFSNRLKRRYKGRNRD